MLGKIVEGSVYLARRLFAPKVRVDVVYDSDYYTEWFERPSTRIVDSVITGLLTEAVHERHGIEGEVLLRQHGVRRDGRWNWSKELWLGDELVDSDCSEPSTVLIETEHGLNVQDTSIVVQSLQSMKVRRFKKPSTRHVRSR